MQHFLEGSISSIHHVNSYNLEKSRLNLLKTSLKLHIMGSWGRCVVCRDQMLWLALLRSSQSWAQIPPDFHQSALKQGSVCTEDTIPALPTMLHTSDVVLNHLQPYFYNIMTRATPIFQELLAMWRSTNADFKRMHPSVKDPSSPANIIVKEAKENATPLRIRSPILPVWDIWCSPLGCADTPVSGQQGGNFCPPESGNSYKSPATIETKMTNTPKCVNTQ